MFKTVKDNWKKAEAAAVVETLFEKQRVICDGEPKLRANSVVQNCWERGSSLLDGSRGPRPHRVAIAAISLADAIKYESGIAEDKLYLMLSLRELLEGVFTIRSSSTFNELDEKLFEIAEDAYDKFFEIVESKQSPSVLEE